MLRYLFLLCAFIANISFAQTWENYIKYFPRKERLKRQKIVK